MPSSWPSGPDSSSTLTCITPGSDFPVSTLQDGDHDTHSISLRSDPRRMLLSDDLLLCEVPMSSVAGAHDGTQRVYAVLGTVVVPQHGAPVMMPVSSPPPHVPALEALEGTEAQAATHPPQERTGDPLLSFDEWKEQHLEHARKSAKSKKAVNKTRDTTKAETADATPSTSTTTQAASKTLTPLPNDPRPTAEKVLAHAIAMEPDPPIIVALEEPSSELRELKHRWNYASLDCAAVLHQANPSAKFASAILSEKKDRYMLSPCPSQSGKEGHVESQFVIVELCQQIRVDTVVLANLEFFSSMFKLFSVRVARSLHAPETEWHSLGLFHARNIRGPQVFKLEHAPQSYYRFMRIDFLEHYGTEYYCPVSLLRVYGRNEREDADEDILNEMNAMEDDEGDEEEECVVTDVECPPDTEVVWSQDQWMDPACASPLFSSLLSPGCVWDRPGRGISPLLMPPMAVWPTLSSYDELVDGEDSILLDMIVPTPELVSMPTSLPTSRSSATTEHVTLPTSVSRFSDVDPAITLTSTSVTTATNTTRSTLGGMKVSDNDTLDTKKKGITKNADKTKSSYKASNETKSSSGSNSSSGSSSNGGGESIFRTITKRLSALEANTSLSMQFLQLNSELLRDKINQLESTQELRLNDLIKALNTTQTRLTEDRMAQHNLALQHTVAALEAQRRRHDAERAVLLARMERMSAEVRTEKRWSMAQLFLLLLMLLITVLTRSSLAPGLLGYERAASEAQRQWADGMPPSFLRPPMSPPRMASPEPVTHLELEADEWSEVQPTRPALVPRAENTPPAYTLTPQAIKSLQRQRRRRSAISAASPVARVRRRAVARQDTLRERPSVVVAAQSSSLDEDEAFLEESVVSM
ncbi:hypothetical protein ACI68E_003359 [Malassezia pachydermatis]